MKGLIMFLALSILAFSMPSFSSETTIFYMPISADIYNECDDGYACADVHVDEFSGIYGVRHGMFTFGAMETQDDNGNDREHYSAGVHFDYELVDGFTPFIGAGFYTGFDDGEHKFQLSHGDITALANIGFEAPVINNIGMRIQVTSNKITTMGIYASW